VNKSFYFNYRWVLPLLLLFSQTSFTQENCSKNLKKAKKFYEEGNIEQVEGLLATCLENGFSRDEKVEGQKLLVLVALFDDDLESADLHMEKFLKLDPEYVVVKGKDQREFIKLYEKFKTLPSISIGVSVGTNMSLINEFTTEGVHPTENSTSSYSSNFGLNFGLKLNKQFTNHLTFELGLDLNSNSFEYSGSYYTNEMALQSTELQTWFSMPAVVSYSFLSGKLKPYVGGGASLGYLLGAKANQDLSYTNDAQRKLPSTTSESSLTSSRERLNYWAILALGARLKIPRALVSFDVRYQHNLKQQTISENRYANSEIYFNTLYLDDDFYMDNLYFSVSYVYSFYNPKKKKAYSKKKNKVKKDEK
jgi:hypothetical protein